jgi:hypothetical protein
MEDLFRSYWWLLFPLAFFAFGAWDRWLYYQRSRDRLELLRTFTAQGKDPPAELLRELRDDDPDDDVGPPFGPYGRMRRRHYRRMYRYSPYWAWRTALITGAVAAGFWVASEYAGIPGTDWPFRLVAIILTFVAAGHLVAAIFSTTFRDR